MFEINKKAEDLAKDAINDIYKELKNDSHTVEDIEKIVLRINPRFNNEFRLIQEVQKIVIKEFDKVTVVYLDLFLHIPCVFVNLKYKNNGEEGK